jgi:hypothetical protein
MKGLKNILSEPRATDIASLIDANTNLELPYMPQDAKANAELFKEHSEFANGKEDWYTPSKKMQNRIKIMKFFTDMSSKQHCEMISCDAFRNLLPVGVVKSIMSIQEHINYSLNENQFNMLLILQGMVIHNFTNLYLRRDMRFRDYIGANNVEYNNPYARERIRQYNRGKNDLGIFYDVEVKLPKFCIDMCGKFFPLMNGIWADSFHFAHVSVLECTRFALEYGFFRAKDCSMLVKVILQACQSMKKLQDAWNEKIEREEDEFKEEQRNDFAKSLANMDTGSQHSRNSDGTESPGKGPGIASMLLGGLSPVKDGNTGLAKLSAKAKMKMAMKKQKEGDVWMKSDKRKRLIAKMQKVADYMAVSKEHISHITIHLITLLYDDTMVRTYPNYIYKNLSFVSEEAERERMALDCAAEFPFFHPNYKNALLEITYTFLSEVHYFGDIKVYSDGSRAGIEKLFMYVSTAERDCFLNSMRMVTASDTKYFEFNVGESPRVADRVLMMRNSIIILLDHLATSGFNKFGVIVKPVGDNDPLMDKINLWNPKFKKQKGGLFASFVDDTRSGVKDSKGGDDSIKVGDNIFDMLNLLINDLKTLTKDKDVCVSLSRQAVPLLILTLLDYMSDYLQNLYMDTSNGMNFSINTNIRHQIEDCSMTVFNILYDIAIDNNLAKAQIFKADGAFHLLNLLRRND